MQAFTQPLEGPPSAQAVLWGLTKIKLVSLLALLATLGATQTPGEGLPLASFVGQGPTNQLTVPQLVVHNVMPGNTKTSWGKPGAVTATLASTA